MLNELDWWIADQWEMFKIKEGRSGLEFKKTDEEGNTITVDMSQKWTKLRKSTELKEMYIVRYADDFKIFCRDYYTAKKTMAATKLWLSDNLHLQTSDEKSGITNLRKNYTTFLGIKFKVVPKGSKWIVRSHMADKSKERSIVKIREAWRDIRNPNLQADLDKNITKYNAIVMGLHNYFCMATMVSADFAEIHFRAMGNMNGVNHNRRCIPLLKEGEFHNTLLKDRYGKSEQCRWMNGRLLVPVGYVQYKYPKYKRRSVNKYIRKYDDVENCISFNVMEYMIEHASEYPTLEMADNAVSRYIAQKGKCAVTHEPLSVSDMVCLHIKPPNGNRNDTYKNIILLSKDVSLLILAEKHKDIQKQISILNLSTEMQGKINKLRRLRSLEIIQFEDYAGTTK